MRVKLHNWDALIKKPLERLNVHLENVSTRLATAIPNGQIWTALNPQRSRAERSRLPSVSRREKAQSAGTLFFCAFLKALRGYWRLAKKLNKPVPDEGLDDSAVDLADLLA